MARKKRAAAVVAARSPNPRRPDKADNTIRAQNPKEKRGYDPNIGTKFAGDSRVQLVSERIVEILKPFNPETQRRLLKCVAILLDIPLQIHQTPEEAIQALDAFTGPRERTACSHR